MQQLLPTLTLLQGIHSTQLDTGRQYACCLSTLHSWQFEATMQMTPAETYHSLFAGPWTYTVDCRHMTHTYQPGGVQPKNSVSGTSQKTLGFAVG